MYTGKLFDSQKFWDNFNFHIQNENDCKADSCLNGGKCKDLVNDFECQCRPGYKVMVESLLFKWILQC